MAILAANCPEWVITFWATVSLGGIVAALNGWWTSDEVRYGVENSEPVDKELWLLAQFAAKLLVGNDQRARDDLLDLHRPRRAARNVQ